MSDLIVVSFPSQELAFELRAELAKLQKDREDTLREFLEEQAQASSA